jgi:uncharacterized coiled-coil DUF342 family protein
MSNESNDRIAELERRLVKTERKLANAEQKIAKLVAWHERGDDDGEFEKFSDYFDRLSRGESLSAIMLSHGESPETIESVCGAAAA